MLPSGRRIGPGTAFDAAADSPSRVPNSSAASTGRDHLPAARRADVDHPERVDRTARYGLVARSRPPVDAADRVSKAGFERTVEYVANAGGMEVVTPGECLAELDAARRERRRAVAHRRPSTVSAAVTQPPNASGAQ